MSGSPAPPPLSTVMASSWADALAPHEPAIRAMGDFLRAEVVAGRGYQPTGTNVFRALRVPMSDVKVLIVGQDPYPTPGHAVGLSFAVPPGTTPLPPTLVNIGKELRSDVGVELPSDLAVWSEQGVLLLNRVLTVRPGASGSHRGKGWEAITAAAVSALSARGGPLVAILWGRDAQTLQPLLAGVPTITSVHPSPLSAHRGFFGSAPFSRTNALLAEQGAGPVAWAG